MYEYVNTCSILLTTLIIARSTESALNLFSFSRQYTYSFSGSFYTQAKMVLFIFTLGLKTVYSCYDIFTSLA